MSDFKLFSKYQPTGDQPEAIEELLTSLKENRKYQVLLGVTGSGKTFTIANVIAKINKPTLIISHNKTLAAQLYGEFKQLFPENAVEYFISYYDYYQPEAYVPTKDLYIEKDTDINEQIDKLRLRATMSLMERRDTIIVASVSCIYGLGIPQDYKEALISLKTGDVIERQDLLERLITIHYGRNDIAFERGTFRVLGDVVEIYPAYMEHSIRIEFFDNVIERITRINPIDNKILEVVDNYSVYPAKHFITTQEKLERAIESIKQELDEQIRIFISQNKLIEAQRIEQRTLYDIDMLKELNYCSGIENYSRHLSGVPAGSPPFCLMNYFPEDYLVIIDESHATIPQINAMYGGDVSRKRNLVDYGFRLPSAYDNRPLTFYEFDQLLNQVIFVSATPGDYELEKTYGVFVEQIIRPTGLPDPQIVIKPLATQVDDLLEEIRLRVNDRDEDNGLGGKILVTTLTKRMAEDLTDYLKEAGVRVRYLHSEVETIKRSKLIRELRLGEYDVLVGINLLREGLDLPEVSLVAILDADKTGFLRSARSLIQTSGRAARNISGKVIFYADKVTPAIKTAIEETNRRREKQLAYNKEHNITPASILKSIEEIMESTTVAEGYQEYEPQKKRSNFEQYLNLESKEEIITLLKKEMKAAAEQLRFEDAAELRDRIFELEHMV
ncbi:MAG: excinuclease ABC subunit UvrB [Candidatus Cloacimonetes bacterium]|nr:excinuclease ABC subunit UvrB [Candidatus Cloacimonadota bacterium]